ncbi:hypothetical protein FBUS_06874, partial [Fasciolopsis buskii]
AQKLPIYSEYPEKDYELELNPPNVAEEWLLPYVKPARKEMQRWFCCMNKVASKFASNVSSTGSCGAFRKMLYATMSASLATAACYPCATLHYTRTAWEHSKQSIVALKDELYKKVIFQRKFFDYPCLRSCSIFPTTVVLRNSHEGGTQGKRLSLSFGN